MDRLTAMEAFVRVVETGSFTRAAGQLRLSRAMVSKYVQELENRLGVRLLNRTTRRLSLTEAGAAYYERCARIVADAAEADQVAARLNLSPQGLLKINAPMSFGTRHLAPAIPDFIAAYPAISVEMTQNDHLVDLLEEGYDVAVRIGRLADSSLVARRIAPCRLVICASPAYLDRRGRPRHPDDLADHDCLGYTYSPPPDVWRLSGPDGERQVRISGPFRANNGDTLRAAALAGLGLAIQPTFIVGADIEAGLLEPVLLDHPPPTVTIHAVYPHGRHLSAKVRCFVDFLAERFGPDPYWDRWLRRTGDPKP
jgi:DNA-binding transcriptional LysR family regulator